MRNVTSLHEMQWSRCCGYDCDCDCDYDCDYDFWHVTKSGMLIHYLRFGGMFVMAFQIKRRHIPEDSNVHFFDRVCCNMNPGEEK